MKYENLGMRLFYVCTYRYHHDTPTGMGTLVLTECHHSTVWCCWCVCWCVCVCVCVCVCGNYTATSSAKFVSTKHTTGSVHNVLTCVKGKCLSIGVSLQLLSHTTAHEIRCAYIHDATAQKGMEGLQAELLQTKISHYIRTF